MKRPAFLTSMYIRYQLINEEKFQIANHDWFGSWLASDSQLHFILQNLNYSSLYDYTHGQFSVDTMDFW